MFGTSSSGRLNKKFSVFWKGILTNTVNRQHSFVRLSLIAAALAQSVVVLLTIDVVDLLVFISCFFYLKGNGALAVLLLANNVCII